MGFGAALAAGAGIASDLSNVFANVTNYIEQKNTREQNERLMYEAWARDDTARQRMVNDLEKAGLSKWLATGASPMTSSPVSLSAPEMGQINLDAMQHMFDNKLKEEQTNAQTALQDKQASLADASTAVANAELKIKNEELREKKADADIAEHNSEVWSNRPGIASNDPPVMKYISEGSNLLSGNSKAGGRVGEGVRQVIKVAADTSPAIGAVVGAVKAGRYVKDKVKNFFSGEDKMTKQPEKKPLNYSTWRKLNNKPNNSASKREYQSYFDNFEY